MTAPLGPVGLLLLIVGGLGVLAFILAWGGCRAAKLGDVPDGATLTDQEQAAIDELECQFRGRP